MIYIEKYSWSRINSFYQGLTGDGCLYCWYKTYRENNRGESNFFSDVGTLTHEIIEDFNHGKIDEWEIQERFEQRFNDLPHKVFPKMMQSYFNSLTEFFGADDFAAWFKDYEVLESEDGKEFMVGDYVFVGFPDMVARHREYGLSIVDIKTSKCYTGAKLKYNIMQLYLYSIPVYEKYGEWPQHLIFYHPRDEMQKEYVYPFDHELLRKTKEFCIDVVKQIEQCKEFPARCEQVNAEKDFYANSICNHRGQCQYKTNW